MPLPTLGVVVVTFNSVDIIQDCLESLLASRGVRLEIVVVDNASSDETLAGLRGWASGQHPYTVPYNMPFVLTPTPKPVTLFESFSATHTTQNHTITLITADVNGGFAAGVNRGLAELAERRHIDRFWVLNPDSAVPPETAAAFATHVADEFALMGGRVLYYDDPDSIQIDGGTVNRLTGITGNINLFRPTAEACRPDPTAMDFITGASMIASRAFYEAAGPMPEEYFLYYEEVDWAFRRGEMALAYCPEAVVYHKAGTAIGSATMNRPASAFSQYFKHRARMLFMRRYFPACLPIALAYSFVKAAQLSVKGYRKEAEAMLLASLNRPPPPEIRNVLSQEAARLAFPALKR